MYLVGGSVVAKLAFATTPPYIQRAMISDSKRMLFTT